MRGFTRSWRIRKILPSLGKLGICPRTNIKIPQNLNCFSKLAYLFNFQKDGFQISIKYLQLKIKRE